MKNKLTITPGDDMHMNCLMAPYSLNMVVGEDRQHLLAFGKAAFAAGQKSAAHESLQAGQEAWHKQADRLKKCLDYATTGQAQMVARIRLQQHLDAAPQPAPDKDAEIAALKKENEAFKAVTTTWTDAATDFRDTVLHGLDGLDNDQTNTVLSAFDEFLPIAQAVQL